MRAKVSAVIVMSVMAASCNRHERVAVLGTASAYNLTLSPYAFTLAEGEGDNETPPDNEEKAQYHVCTNGGHGVGLRLYLPSSDSLSIGEGIGYCFEVAWMVNMRVEATF